MLATLAFIVAATKSTAPITVDGVLCHPRNLMVKYENERALKSLKMAGRIVRLIPQIHYAVVETPIGQLKATLKKVRNFNGVARAELDRCALPAYNPNDEYWPNEWHMRAINADKAWDTTKGNPGVIVAVIDTGVKVDHPDLAANIWVNSGEIPGNGLDDDNDGYIDDVNGYDFAYNDGSPNDNHGHGTACSGLVAGIQDNTIGVSGVAPSCKVMALKAAQDDGYFFDSANVPAYIYAADHGARVLSMSFFSDRVSQSERDAMEYCWDHGVLPVAASANSSTIYPYYPAAYEHVLSVAAVDGNLNKAGFSDYGSWVDVSAPGVGLYSTSIGGNGYTSGFAGTSGACPHVAGVAALCFSMNVGATNQMVRDAIEDTAILQSQAPYGEFSNYGLVDAEKAVLRMAGGGTRPHPPVLRYVTRYIQNGSRFGARQIGRIYGRGFGAPNTVQLTTNGLPLGVLARSRDWIDIDMSGTASSQVTVNVNGNLVGSVSFPGTASTSYLITEASSPGATLEGGFFEALSQDASFIRSTLRGDNTILVQATFRKVTPTGFMNLTYRRQYTGTTVGTETVQLYDWSSASYPYGSFVTVGSGACPTSMTTSTFTVPNAARFVDPEGTVYLLITTSNDLPAGAELHIDNARLNG